MNFPQHIQIAGRTVGPGQPCLVIAEGGVNHFGDMEKAFALVDLAVEAKADIFKIQHFNTEALIGPSAPDWRQRMATKQLSHEQVLMIQQYCHKQGIAFLCTGHDDESLQFLHEQAKVEGFKVGSGEWRNWPYLETIASWGKPIILSTGMHSLEDIADAVNIIQHAGSCELAVLHCITHYPAAPQEINLSVMAQIREFFSGPVGYSDHTAGTAVPLAAVALGANIIEKHITLDRDVANAQDWKVSCGPENFAKFVADVREIEAACRGGRKQISVHEETARAWATKSLTALCDIPEGTKLDATMFRAMRPGGGYTPGEHHFITRQAGKTRYCQGYDFTSPHVTTFRPSMTAVPLRVIPRLDIKGENVIKGVHLEGLKVVGDPAAMAATYYQQGADELVFMDVVASLYGRNSLDSLVSDVAREIFIPLTVGGGIRSLEDIQRLLRCGADKVAINTQATQDPGFLHAAAHRFGSQCIVLSVEAKQVGENSWQALTDNGREQTGLDVIEWLRQAQDLGVGEVMLTSVDKEGTNQGFDVALLYRAREVLDIPLIACGGAGEETHVVDLRRWVDVDGICCASMFHYERVPLPQLKHKLKNQGVEVRL